MADGAEKSCVNFAALADLLHKHKRISGKVADSAKEQYKLFVGTEVKQNINTFRKFDMDNTRLDTFLGDFMIGVPKYNELWGICIFVFTLSHGQAGS